MYVALQPALAAANTALQAGCADGLRDQDISVSKAKKAIFNYWPAMGRPEGLAELSVFYQVGDHTLHPAKADAFLLQAQIASNPVVSQLVVQRTLVGIEPR